MESTKPRQQELDFSSEGWRKYAVEHSTALRELYATEGSGQRRRSIKLRTTDVQAVLYRIAKFSESYETVARLAEECDIAVRTVERILRALADAGLMVIDKVDIGRGHLPRNRYVVFWSELTTVKPAQKFCPPSATPSAMPSATPSAMVADNRTDKYKELTTTDAWEVVVVSLEKSGVTQSAKAIAFAKQRGATPEQVLEQLADLRRQTTNPGVIYNQIRRPTAAPSGDVAIVHRPKPRPSTEQLRTRAFKALREQLGRIPSEDEIERFMQQPTNR